MFLSRRLFRLARHQSALIAALQEENLLLQLEHARNLRELIVQFRIAIERPEDDIRDLLDLALVDLEDSVARMEEYVL